MPCWHRHHERVTPGGDGDDPISNLIGLRESHVVQIVVQALDLLRQRHLEEADFNLRFFLPAQRQQCWQARGRDTVGQRDTQLAVEAIGGCLYAVARLL
ncbi:hypothetical protein D9M69_452850 [compost metagenome]